MTEKNDFSFTRKDVDGLTDALAKMAVLLDQKEWGLLLAIFAAAADHIKLSKNTRSGTLPGVQIMGDGEKVEDPGQADARELRDQLLQAYIPGRQPPGSVGSVTPIRPKTPPNH